MSKVKTLDFSKLDTDIKLDTGLRLILDYIPGSDSIVTRIDIKVENRQYCAAIVTSWPIEPKSGQKISPMDDLVTPNKGVERCFNIKVGKKELIAALKELVSDLENDGKL